MRAFAVLFLRREILFQKCNIPNMIDWCIHQIVHSFNIYANMSTKKGMSYSFAS